MTVELLLPAIAAIGAGAGIYSATSSSSSQKKILAESQASREDAKTQLLRQQQELQAQQAEQDAALGKVGRNPRGRRLLLASSSGEGGVQSTLG